MGAGPPEGGFSIQTAWSWIILGNGIRSYRGLKRPPRDAPCQNMILRRTSRRRLTPSAGHQAEVIRRRLSGSKSKKR